MTPIDAAELIIGAASGAVVTLVALRTKLAMMQRDITDESSKRRALGGVLDEHIQRSDRRQRVMLKLLADVARAVNVDKRTFDDALVRMLTEDTNDDGG